MADNNGSLNRQYDVPFFPGIDSGAQGRFRAPGSAGITAEATAGGEVGTPVVTDQYGSSQVPANLPRVSVMSGDTSGMADDQPAHASVTVPGPESDYMSAGPRPNVKDHFGRFPWQQPDGRA
jgi:hypothetical protein